MLLLRSNREVFADLCLSLYLIAKIVIYYFFSRERFFFFFNLVIQKINFSALVNNFG